MRLELKHGTVRYPTTDAIKDVSLSIEQGSFVAIMGATGSGKTTLLEVLAGLIPLTEGSVSPTGFSQRVGIVMQHPEDQLFASTVEEDVQFALKRQSLSEQERERKVKEALDLVGFTDMHACPLTLSGGQKRDVAIAGVLVFHPHVLLLDEPTSGLDPHSRTSLLQTLAEINARGDAIVMASHDADAVAEYASRLLIMDHGKILRDGTPSSLFMDIEGMRHLHLGVSHARTIASLMEAKGVRLPKGIVKEADLISALEDIL